MQIVIDIPYTQKQWENAKNYGHIDIDGVEIALPKGHGRLMDSDYYKEKLEYFIAEAGWGDEIIKVLRWCKDEFLDECPTIIESDKEE